MSARTLIVIILALSCGATAAVGVSQYRSLLPGPTADVAVKTVAVLVANTDVARGNVLGANQLSIGQWPEEHVPAGALSKTEQAIERTAVVKLFAGDFILEQKLAPSLLPPSPMLKQIVHRCLCRSPMLEVVSPMPVV